MIIAVLGEDITADKDGGVLRSKLQQGEGYQTPNDGAQCNSKLAVVVFVQALDANVTPNSDVVQRPSPRNIVWIVTHPFSRMLHAEYLSFNKIVFYSTCRKIWHCVVLMIQFVF